MSRWAELVSQAAEASERFGDDELEAYAAAHPPTVDELAATRAAYIDAAGYAAVPVILRAEGPASTEPRYVAAKLRLQTRILMRRYRVSL